MAAIFTDIYGYGKHSVCQVDQQSIKSPLAKEELKPFSSEILNNLSEMVTWYHNN